MRIIRLWIMNTRSELYWTNTYVLRSSYFSFTNNWCLHASAMIYPCQSSPMALTCSGRSPWSHNGLLPTGFQIVLALSKGSQRAKCPDKNRLSGAFYPLHCHHRPTLWHCSQMDRFSTCAVELQQDATILNSNFLRSCAARARDFTHFILD